MRPGGLRVSPLSSFSLCVESGGRRRIRTSAPLSRRHRVSTPPHCRSATLPSVLKLVAQAGFAPAPSGLQPDALLAELPRALWSRHEDSNPAHLITKQALCPMSYVGVGSAGRIRTCTPEGSGLTVRCGCQFHHRGTAGRGWRNRTPRSVPTPAFETGSCPARHPLSLVSPRSGIGGRIRTCGLRLRRAALCPTELRRCVWYRGWDSNPH